MLIEQPFEAGKIHCYYLSVGDGWSSAAVHFLAPEVYTPKLDFIYLLPESERGLGASDNAKYLVTRLRSTFSGPIQ